MTKTEKHQSILIIDDDPVYRKLSRSILSERFKVFVVEKPSLGFKVLKTESIDFIICDYQLPEMDGLEFLEKSKKQFPDIEVIMISSEGDMNTVIEALRKGAADYFKKPFSATDLWMSIERTRKHKELRNDLKLEKNKNTVLQKEIGEEKNSDLIGKTSDFTNIKKQMELVAKTPDTSVLIIGESGTGKELFAREIHALSNRNDNFFGAVNMSAIPENLFESEFFGHKKGSFTGAISDRAGWFETTNKGTLFLDEIGETSMSLQVKLLRVLEDRTYTKVGSQQSKSFDVRIVAATNKSVESLTDEKEFRLDLFHRLGTFIINIPPLRERKEDIPELLSYFLKMHTKKLGSEVTKINKETIELLKAYPFPGNIRELKNLMERAIIVCDGKELLPKHFNLFGSTVKNIDTFDLAEVERNVILRALEKTNHNKAEAARLLNIEWNALYRRMQKHGIKEQM